MLLKIIKKLKRIINIDKDFDLVRQDILDLKPILEQISVGKEPETKIPEQLLFIISRLIPNASKSCWLINQIDTSISNYSAPKSLDTFQEDERKLQALDPKIFPIYKTLFENGKKAYETQAEGNFSNWDSTHSCLFEKYVFNYISGRVLDIGCGTDYKPIYLTGYPDNLISAIEPLELKYKPTFEIVRGFCEFLPWNDNSFSTAIAATSFDHVLNLETSLEEIKRVLLPNGLFIVWIASSPGAKAYEPTNPNFTNVDDFHLFHFDEKWFEPLVVKHQFEIVDKTKIPHPGFDHIFYCLQSKKVIS